MTKIILRCLFESDPSGQKIINTISDGSLMVERGFVSLIIAGYLKSKIT